MSNITVQSIVDEAPIIAIIRRPKVDPVRCIEHLFQNGIRLVEITMDTPGAVEVLKAQHSRVPANALLGAGTVTNVAEAEAALAAGATFIVTPNIYSRHRWGKRFIGPAVRFYCERGTWILLAGYCV